MYERAESTAAFIRERIPFESETAIILGTGLGGLISRIENRQSLEYADIPGFPLSTVEGHHGRFIFGTMGGKNIIAMQGRFHYYEGYDIGEVVFPVRVLGLSGIKRLFVSNASGGLNPEFEMGELMIITDHINLIPNPLIGPNEKRFGVRFPDMSRPYSRTLTALCEQVAAENGIRVKKGVYVATTGPTFETPAEYKYFRIIGGDAVGMSTAPEVIAARHCGIEVFGISIITDLGVDGKIVEVSHEEVQIEGAKAEAKMTILIKGMLEKL